MTARVNDAELVGHFEPGSPEWHAARSGPRLGGSEIPAAMGLSPFESRYSLWHRKAGLIGPVEESPEMEWGKRLEDAVCAKFGDAHDLGGLLERSGTYRHLQRRYQVANPDRLILDLDGRVVSLLETKTSPFGDRWGEAGGNEIPVHVRAQTLWYLDTLGLPVGHVAVLISGMEYREYVVEYDPAEAQLLRDAAVEFIESLVNGEKPSIDDHDATYQAIQELHPDIEPRKHELTDAVAREFIAARAGLKAATAAALEAKSQVADEMGNAQYAVWAGFDIARRQSKNGGLPYLVTAKDLPDFTEPTGTTDSKETAA